ncbi:cytochrome c biogenesis protein CcsA [Thalassolituus sp. ST750PaO-4]|uniref:cytochrome C assembly family protein n=1 Tax=Thalassolituus sp. ST750PaO-4 TaxID=2742965 RepID=UPI000C3CEDFA|nr:cytochrome c biogenesis protein CcsA [Thalassolituus sp. ST750PaO-4]MCA6059418.1 cytochrome c biogenesis protein CcsA [Thalassolituus sp. ST750PaO-4]PIQ40090.1 MAG: phosphohydrolase [Thalassolituus sp. CG17_big_fil_post_rev_8_21_14_2_50_53_8]
MSGLVLALPAAGFYLFAAWRQWQTVSGQKTASRMPVLMSTMIAALLHLGYIGMEMLGRDHINFAMFEVGSLICWVITLLLLFSGWKKPVDNLFIGLLPMAAVILLLAAVSGQQMPLEHLSYGLAWHILLSILAYSVFTIAAVQSVLLYLQDLALKKRQTRGLVQALPPLQTMDLLLFEMVWLGMILLTAAFAIGWPYVFDLKAQHLLHKVVFASLGWIVFAILLVGRYRFGWRGVIASRWTLIGTGFLVLSYFGTKFVLEMVLQR